MTEYVYLPFPKQLYDDLIRFSDGRCDPMYWAVDRLEQWIESNFYSECNGNGWRSDSFMDQFSDRIEDFAEEYYPWALAHWEKQGERHIAERRESRRPLVWKAVTIAAESEVRMSYGGLEHYAKVKDGKIKDGDGEFSPSEWASKVAGETSRNAWRDLWFKAPEETTWVPAMLLREKLRKSLKIDF
jgi:hypothetical protein